MFKLKWFLEGVSELKLCTSDVWLTQFVILLGAKFFFVTWGVKRRIWCCCKYWRFVQNLIACVNFEACFKGQRWIVCTHASHSWGTWKLMSCCNGTKHSDFACFVQKKQQPREFLVCFMQEIWEFHAHFISCVYPLLPPQYRKCVVCLSVCVLCWGHLPRQSDCQHYCVCVSGL